MTWNGNNSFSAPFKAARKKKQYYTGRNVVTSNKKQAKGLHFHQES